MSTKSNPEPQTESLRRIVRVLRNPERDDRWCGWDRETEEVYFSLDKAPTHVWCPFLAPNGDTPRATVYLAARSILAQAKAIS